MSAFATMGGGSGGGGRGGQDGKGTCLVLAQADCVHSHFI